MGADVVQLAQVLFTVLVFVVGISVVGLVNRYVKRRLERPLPPENDQRLDRIEQAVDAIAIEVERISEAQRYSARLLSERQAADPPPIGRSPELGHATPV